MTLFWFLRKLRTRSDNSRIQARSNRTRKPRYRNLWVERLEDRTVPSITIGNNGGQGLVGLTFNQSGGFVPPDTNAAVGPSSIMETVNQEVAIYSPKSTGATTVSDSLGHFLFSVGGLTRANSGSGQSDPVITYDELAGRFIIGDQDVNFNNHVSAFDVAVSKSNNPTTLTAADWVFYKITTTESGFDADFPGNFGYNQDAVVITLNMFGVFGGGHVQVLSLNAADLANGVSQANLHSFKNDLNDFAVRPTAMHGSHAGDPMWMVTEHGDNTSIDVIKMSSSNGTVLSNAATFTYTNLAVTSYSSLVAPLNPNGKVITSNIDSRIQKAAEANNILVAAHAVAVSSTQDVIQWYAIDVSGTPTLSSSSAQQGRVSSGNNTYLYYPAIDINTSGQIGMTYMQSGTDTSSDFMSMYVTGRLTGDATGTMEAPVLVPAGTGQTNYADFSGSGRAGDIGSINVDPSDGSFWAANEFANTQATANWGTAIANFAVSGTTTSADMAVTASGPSSITAGTNATYTITITNNGPNSAQGVVLTDAMPTGAVFVSMTPSSGNPDSFTFSQSGSTLTETAGASIASGSSDTFTLVVSAPSNLANGANFSDTASVSSSTTDPNSGNNSATVTGSIVNNSNSPGSDLAVTDSGPSSNNEGDNSTFTITVTNKGPADATNVVLTDTLGSNFSFVSATAGQGTFTQSGSTVTFTVGTVANGASVTFTVVGQSNEEGSLTDSASVTADQTDPNTNNNSATATVTVAEPPIVVSPPKSMTGQFLINATVATFTHASGVEPASAFAATINWGDGKTSAGTITKSGSTYTVKGTHLYSSGVIHTVTTTVREIGNAPSQYQLLLNKIGDEKPDLPDHFDLGGGGGGRHAPAHIPNPGPGIGAHHIATDAGLINVLVGQSAGSPLPILFGRGTIGSEGVNGRIVGSGASPAVIQPSTHHENLLTTMTGNHQISAPLDNVVRDSLFVNYDLFRTERDRLIHESI
jgi:uncharacterized repeat protein (TIGR01451 family)